MPEVIKSQLKGPSGPSAKISVDKDGKVSKEIVPTDVPKA